MILGGDCLTILPTLEAGSVQCVVTSPPYWGLRDYGVDGQLGLEKNPEEYVAKMVAVFREVKRVLRDDGTLWLNLGDSYAGSAQGWGHGKQYAGEKQRTNKGSLNQSMAETIGFNRPPGYISSKQENGLKPKDLVGIPWRVAFALQADGWYLRSDIIWAKPNPMPESVTDRPTKSHEYIFLLTKSATYYYDNEAVKEKCSWSESWSASDTHTAIAQGGKHGKTSIFNQRWEDKNGGRNRRSVWTISTRPFSGSHFAVFPPEIPTICIKAGSRGPGKRCDCGVLIATPTGTVETDDPSMKTGRAGMNRPRGTSAGTRQITRREQRWEAEQMRNSPHREKMQTVCGSAFDHYIRTDNSGARPLPENIRKSFKDYGWISEAPPCDHPIEPGDTILDPFAGAGTVGLVCEKLDRKFIGIELNPAYVEMAEKRIEKVKLPLLEGMSEEGG